MKHLLLISVAALSTFAGTTSIQKVEKFIENKNCERVTISESKKVNIYRACSDTYVIQYDDFKNIVSALRYDEKGEETELRVK